MHADFVSMQVWRIAGAMVTTLIPPCRARRRLLLLVGLGLRWCAGAGAGAGGGFHRLSTLD